MIRWLLITLIVVFVWSGFASYWYVCNVRGLCSSEEVAAVSEEKKENEMETPIETIESKEPLFVENQILGEKIEPEVVVKNEPVIVPKLQDYFVAYLNLENLSIVNLGEFQNFISNLKEFKSEVNSIFVIGYTDDAVSQKESFNYGLGLANHIKEILSKEGFSEDKIVIGSRGKFDPIYNNESNEKYKNIRVEISLNKGV